MSLEHSPGRETRRRLRRTRAAVESAVYSIQRFCDSHEISRTQLYKLWREGRGPSFFWLGDQKRITAEAAAAWREQMQAASDALTENQTQT
jgi:hypothetical protein